MDPPHADVEDVADDDAGVRLPVGRKGQCWDDAVAESFFATIKIELLDRQPWPAKTKAQAIFESIRAGITPAVGTQASATSAPPVTKPTAIPAIHFAVLHFRVPSDALSNLSSRTFTDVSPDLADFVRYYRGGGDDRPYELVDGPMLGNPRPLHEGQRPEMVWQPSGLLRSGSRVDPRRRIEAKRMVMAEFLFPMTDDVAELVAEIAGEMVQLFGISRAEAVARINAQWRGQGFLEQDEVILHEDAYYWALFIYYRDVPNWAPDADRSGWTPVAAPAADSGCWTL